MKDENSNSEFSGADQVATEATSGVSKKSKHWFMKAVLISFAVGIVLAGISAVALLTYFSRTLPAMISIADYKPLGVTRVLSASNPNEVIAEFLRERRYLVPFEKIPKVVVQAFVAAEDDTFFQHQGVNPLSMLRAFIANFRAGHYVQGGSTITQQVAKSLMLTSEKSLTRKIKEVLLASRMERNLGKEQILYLYLNQIYLGHGAYGVQAAAKAYFSKDVSELTAAEAAILAGLPQAPSKYGPHINPKRAKERQTYVLRRMMENGFITREAMADALAQPVKIFLEKENEKKTGAYYVEHVRRYITEKYGEERILDEGLNVYVPTNLELMQASESSVVAGLHQFERRQVFRGAIKKLKTELEIEKYVQEQKSEFIKGRLGFVILTPDGRIEVQLNEEKLKETPPLKDGDFVEAVVSAVDDKKKSIVVSVLGNRAEIPWAGIRWIHINATKEITLPSQALSRGDVVWVSAHKKSAVSSDLVFELEQGLDAQAALICLDVQSGNVLAMEGGNSFEASEFNRALQAQRQPGSAFKPIVFSAALENGYTPATIIVDSPIVYEDADNGKWKPNNFEEKFYGDTTFRQALIKSRNVPTIKIAQDLKAVNIVNYARRLGIDAKLPEDLAVALGSGGISLLELAKAYAIFPRLGKRIRPVFVTKVEDRSGKILEESRPLLPPSLDQLQRLVETQISEAAAVDGTRPLPGVSTTPQKETPSPANDSKKALVKALTAFPKESDPEQVVDPRVAYLMSHLMNEVVSFGTGTGAKSLGRPAAGKTGTTSEFIDAWFVGFTPNVVTGVWVGNDGQKSLGHNETGARAALPIWLSFMGVAEKKYPEADFAVPPGIVFVPIDAMGRQVLSTTPGAVKEAFIEGTEPLSTHNAGQSGRPDQSQKPKPPSTGDFLKEDIE